MTATEHLLFLTGKLAHDSLVRELEQLPAPGFTWQVHDLGLKVAALMTVSMIRRRLTGTFGADRIILPGLCSGDIQALSRELGIPVERGPKDLKDLAEFFGGKARTADLSRYRVRIFAEIVDAPFLDTAQLLACAARYRDDGADVIDLGCLPEQPFDHLEDSIHALQAAGFQVSVDSLSEDDLLRAGRAGADYLLSLKESTLGIADQVASTPVLIPEQPGDMDSLYRAIEAMQARGRNFLADPILDPIHFGFTDAIVRYHALRQRYPDIPVLCGTGNVTELTDADTTGMTALLMGIVSELDIDAILTTAVSPHARTAVREADLARRMMFAARQDGNLPRRYGGGLMAHRERKPFVHDTGAIAAMAAAVRDPNFRIQVNQDGIHLYNRDGRHCATDPFELYPCLGEPDSGHAFYLGVELGRAQIAWQLGKRYLQDNELDWGVVTDPPEAADNAAEYRAVATTSKKYNQSS